MSSVRNRILQFQQNDNNAAAASSSPNGNSSSSSIIKNGLGNGNGSANTSLSSSTASTLNLKSSYARTRSVGSIPPDIVATTTSANNNNNGVLSRSKSGLNGAPAPLFNSNTSSNCNNNISISTSNLKPTFPYGNTTQKLSNQQHSNSNNNNRDTSYFGSNYGVNGSGLGLKTTSNSIGSSSSVTSSSASNSLINIRKYSGTFSDCSSSTTSLASSWRSGSVEKKSPAPEPSSTIVRTVEIPLGNREQLGTPPIVNRANKPGSLAMKKASMSINLSSAGGSLSSSGASVSSSSPSPTGNTTRGILNGSSNGNGRTVLSPTSSRPKARAPTTVTSPSPASSTSSIPKLSGGGGSNGYGFGSSAGTATTPTTVRYRDPSPGGIGRTARRSPATSNRTTPATTPTGTNGGVAFGSTWNGGGSSMGKFYQSIMWKEKFEESEKKKDHLVILAQKATRDYEELRRRYHDLYTDHEKLATRFESATSQLESLRKASEATYEAYHKLKRRYEAENQEKSEALTRVDEYNKENRRLKRQSALMMQQIDPSTLLTHANMFDAVAEGGDSPESDKEIQYLRQKVKELEGKIVDLETELERIRLSEFESQESVLLMTDSIQTSNKENLQLKDKLRKLDEENRRLARSLEDLSMEHESLRAKQSVEAEKLQVAETELKKLLTEKNILQRQSLVFMNNDEMDNRLLDALAQIEDLQRTVEDQKNEFETQIQELKDRLSEKEFVEETSEIQQSAKIKALEEEIRMLRERAEEAERKLEDCSSSTLSSSDGGSPAPPPPPPPPPMMGGPAPPPPPPPPSMSLGNMRNGGNGLESSLQAGLTSLKKGTRSNLETTPNGSCDGQSKSMLNASPQIDDIVSQLKQGIKLRHIDRTTPRKQLTQERSKDDNPVEELRSVLDNMRRSRTVDRRFDSKFTP